LRSIGTIGGVLLLFVLTAAAAAAEARSRYNVLLFTADDMHAESIRVYGSRTDMTPQLDRFAASGMVFDRAHVNAAICAPSRAIIATGLYGHNSGAMGFMPAKPGTPEIVTTFQKAGYLAGVLGKVGHSTPVRATKWDYSFDRPDLGNGRSPTIYYERSKVFFERARSEKKPFYLMANSHDPHRPYCYPDKLLKGAERPSKVYGPEDVEVPGFVPDLAGVRAELAAYQNSTRRLDDTFGKVMQALDESGFAGSTLVVFMSDNGIAIPFAKCNAWFHSSRTPMLVRLPGVVKPGTRDTKHFVSGVDLWPTFLELTGVEGPEKLDGRSFLPLLKGQSQEGREFVFTQIDKKAGNDAVPMRCIQNARYGYIYNPFSDGKHLYRNNNEGKTMAAMNASARTDPAVAQRVKLFRYRVPEELYDLSKDRDCLRNLIDSREHADIVRDMRKRLEDWMVATGDPMLEALRNREDRGVVDSVMEKTYGKPRQKTKGKRKRKKKGANDE
jgi:N-sulfoglucosamine sulfohydrolase